MKKVRHILLIVAVSGAAGMFMWYDSRTVPVVPTAPTPQEQPLVDRAGAWCKNAGYPAGVPTRPFFTDGCTGWPDGDLYGCCVKHDFAYWCGGTEAGRLEADRAFRACAGDKSPAQSGLVYYGVCVGGVPWLPTPWRWGYGHPYAAELAKRDRAAPPDVVQAEPDPAPPEEPFDPEECPKFHQVPADEFAKKYGDGDDLMWWPVVMPMKAPESCECWNHRVRTQGWGDDWEDDCDS